MPSPTTTEDLARKTACNLVRNLKAREACLTSAAGYEQIFTLTIFSDTYVVRTVALEGVEVTQVNVRNILRLEVAGIRDGVITWRKVNRQITDCYPGEIFEVAYTMENEGYDTMAAAILNSLLA